MSRLHKLARAAVIGGGFVALAAAGLAVLARLFCVENVFPFDTGAGR